MLFFNSCNTEKAMCFVGNWVEVDEKQIWFIDCFRLDQNGTDIPSCEKKRFFGLPVHGLRESSRSCRLDGGGYRALGWWVF